MMNEQPTKITVGEYYRQNYIVKVAKKECVVSVPGYASSWIEDVEDIHGQYLVRFQDFEGPHAFNFWPDEVLNVYWLQPAQASPQPTASADATNGDAMLAANLDHVSTQWVQLHQELSTALGLDFEPNEDIERYSEAIEELRNDKHNEAFVAGYNAGKKVYEDELATLRADNARMAAAIAAARAAIVEALRLADSLWMPDMRVKRDYRFITETLNYMVGALQDARDYKGEGHHD